MILSYDKFCLDAGVSREFRIVRDNRVMQTANRDVKPEPVQHSASGKDQAKSDFPEKRCGISSPCSLLVFQKNNRFITP